MFVKPLLVELFIMVLVGYYFVFLDPWVDPLYLQRLPTQRLPLRTTVGIIRFLELILTYSYYNYIFRKNLLTLGLFLKTIFGLVLISVIGGTIDLWFFSGAVREFLIPHHYALHRFTGLTGEPRAIGQYCTLSIFIFITLGVSSSFKRIRIQSYVGLLLCFWGIALSFSSTAIGLTFICLFVYFLLGQMHIKYLIAFFLIGLIGFQVLKNDKYFVEHQRKRIAIVALEKSRGTVNNVPSVFNAFEVFDKSALTFLYFNPQYLFFGVGPNTVNIPASKYLSRGDKTDYEGAIDSVPINFFINVTSRSGILGSLIYISSFILILYRLKKLKTDKLFKLALLFFIYLLFYYNYFFYAVIGIVIGSYDASVNKQNYHSNIT